MPITSTPRLALPLLSTAQAHKEITHNEALLLVDALLCPTAMALPTNTPPLSSAPGQCWIIGPAPTGIWAGYARHVAVFGDGGWRFIAPVAGMAVWIASENVCARYTLSQWIIPPVLVQPVGGTIVDSECRAAVLAIVAQLQANGLCRT